MQYFLKWFGNKWMLTSIVMLIYEIVDNKYKVESIWLHVLWAQLRSILFLSFGRTGRNAIYSLSWRKVSFLSGEEKLNPKRVPPLFAPLPSIYKRMRGFPSSFLSNDGFVSHHYCSSTTASICHLSYCQFSEMDHLTLTLSWSIMTS